MALHGERELRGLRDVGSLARSARVGRLAADAGPPAPPPGDAGLLALADALRDPAPDDPGGDNPAIPAGYTYLGQFVDHDLTFDAATLHDRERDPDATASFRTPKLDLDSVYASGPDVSPHLYARADAGWRLLTGDAPDGGVDLPRNGEGVALAGDPRNDDNVIIGQLHLAFLLLHNRIASELADEDETLADDPRGLLRAARQRVCRHYQWVVVHDLLVRIAGRDVVERHLAAAAAAGADGADPVIPAEFAGAAFRFGHSMIRSRYRLNGAAEHPIVAADGDDLGGRRPLPLDWRIDWARFFAIGGSVPQASRRIDTRVAPELFALPRGGGSLPLRDLRRGRELGLPSGEAMAARLGVEPIPGGDGATPLWLYLLREAEAATGGERLGPTGAELVAGVVVDVLRRDADSWLAADPSWRPELPCEGDDLTAGDLVAYALG